MASDKIDVDVQVVKIEPEGKYIIVFPHHLSNVQAAHVRAELQRFMEGDQTFAILEGGARIERVDDAREPGEKV